MLRQRLSSDYTWRTIAPCITPRIGGIRAPAFLIISLTSCSREMSQLYTATCTRSFFRSAMRPWMDCFAKPLRETRMIFLAHFFASHRVIERPIPPVPPVMRYDAFEWTADVRYRPGITYNQLATSEPNQTAR